MTTWAWRILVVGKPVGTVSCFSFFFFLYFYFFYFLHLKIGVCGLSIPISLPTLSPKVSYNWTVWNLHISNTVRVNILLFSLRLGEPHKVIFLLCQSSARLLVISTNVLWKMFCFYGDLFFFPIKLSTILYELHRIPPSYFSTPSLICH